jgi:hypothetical protein
MISSAGASNEKVEVLYPFGVRRSVCISLPCPKIYVRVCCEFKNLKAKKKT